MDHIILAKSFPSARITTCHNIPDNCFISNLQAIWSKILYYIKAITNYWLYIISICARANFIIFMYTYTSLIILSDNPQWTRYCAPKAFCLAIKKAPDLKKIRRSKSTKLDTGIVAKKSLNRCATKLPALAQTTGASFPMSAARYDRTRQTALSEP